MRLLTAITIVTALTVATAATAGAPLRVHLNNKSDATITEVYMVLAGSHDDWGPNFVAGSPLAPGAKTQLLVPDGADKCVIDVKIEADGKPDYEKRVVFCGRPNLDYRGR